jgi:hypothetical protein
LRDPPGKRSRLPSLFGKGLPLSNLPPRTRALVWGAASYAFNGTASGAVGSPTSTFANSQGIAMFTFATAMNVSMSWNLDSVTGTSSTALAGWSLDDASTGNTVFGIQFFGTSTTPSSITGGINTNNKLFNLKANIPRFSYNKLDVYDYEINATGSQDSLVVKSKSSSLIFNDSLSFPSN